MQKLFSMLLCTIIFALNSHAIVQNKANGQDNAIAQQENTESPLSPPHIQFERSMADMGTLSVGKGERRKAEFRYTNTGKAPLVIEAAEVDCGCTTVKFSKKPLKPGKTGKLTVTFDATKLDERGVVGNVITIFVNSPQRYTRIRIKAVLTD